MEKKRKKMIDEDNVLYMITRDRGEGMRLVHQLSPALDAIRVYESVKTRPGQFHSAEAKLRYAERKAFDVIKILSEWSHKTGRQMLTQYIKDENRIELIMDLDDFLNELYCQKQSEAGR